MVKKISLDEYRKKVKQHERELNIRTNQLKEVNTTLDVILKKREKDKIELQKKVRGNMIELVSPYLEKLKKTELRERQKIYLDILESNLNEITSPLLGKLASSYINLTPQEIQVANLIKHGKRSKDIAELLNLSIRTIHFHRENIRKKFGIKNHKINLRSYLISLEPE